MKLEEINIRDPFVLLENEKYYLYGSRGKEAWGKCTGLDVYISDDLNEWSPALEVFSKPENFWADMNFWAPEVHKYKNKFYMFVSFKSSDKRRGTQILVADSPTGPFLEHSLGPVTPNDWECLDGTFYIGGDNTPYIVFCHEWLQAIDGEICAMKLSDDLKRSVGDPVVLFKASQSPHVSSVDNNGNFVTDGPFLYRNSRGRLFMLWSSYGKNKKYCELLAYSRNGEIDGEWIQCDEPLFTDDGGHGMIFKTKTNKLVFTMHTPNGTLLERPILLPATEFKDTITLEAPVK